MLVSVGITRLGDRGTVLVSPSGVIILVVSGLLLVVGKRTHFRNLLSRKQITRTVPVISLILYR
jgi:hypothetical protein